MLWTRYLKFYWTHLHQTFRIDAYWDNLGLPDETRLNAINEVPVFHYHLLRPASMWLMRFRSWIIIHLSDGTHPTAINGDPVQNFIKLYQRHFQLVFAVLMRLTGLTRNIYYGMDHHLSGSLIYEQFRTVSVLSLRSYIVHRMDRGVPRFFLLCFSILNILLAYDVHGLVAVSFFVCYRITG